MTTPSEQPKSLPEFTEKQRANLVSLVLDKPVPQQVGDENKSANDLSKATCARTAIPVTFVNKLLLEGTAIKIVQGNPKTGKSGVLYEKYKAATTVKEAIEFGARKADIQHDLQKGFITIDDPARVQEMVDILATKGLSVGSSANLKRLQEKAKNQNPMKLEKALTAMKSEPGCAGGKTKEQWGGVKLTDDDVLVIHIKSRLFRKAKPYIQRRCLAVDGLTVQEAVGKVYKDDNGKDRKYTRQDARYDCFRGWLTVPAGAAKDRAIFLQREKEAEAEMAAELLEFAMESSGCSTASASAAGKRKRSESAKWSKKSRPRSMGSIPVGVPPVAVPVGVAVGSAVITPEAAAASVALSAAARALGDTSANSTYCSSSAGGGVVDREHRKHGGKGGDAIASRDSVTAVAAAPVAIKTETPAAPPFPSRAAAVGAEQASVMAVAVAREVPSVPDLAPVDGNRLSMAYEGSRHSEKDGTEEEESSGGDEVVDRHDDDFNDDSPRCLTTDPTTGSLRSEV